MSLLFKKHNYFFKLNYLFIIPNIISNQFIINLEYFDHIVNLIKNTYCYVRINYLKLILYSNGQYDY